MTDCKYVECAKIINTHGCRGGLKLESWCNTPQELAALKRVYLSDGNGYVEHKVKSASVFKQFVLMDIDGVEDMDTALALKNKLLYADRADFTLKKGEFFIVDIIGTDVIDADSGRVYGKLTDVINRGASDIYVVDTAVGERMIPVVDEFIVRVEPRHGVFVRTIPGLLD